MNIDGITSHLPAGVERAAYIQWAGNRDDQAILFVGFDEGKFNGLAGPKWYLTFDEDAKAAVPARDMCRLAVCRQTVVGGMHMSSVAVPAVDFHWLEDVLKGQGYMTRIIELEEPLI